MEYSENPRFISPGFEAAIKFDHQRVVPLSDTAKLLLCAGGASFFLAESVEQLIERYPLLNPDHVVKVGELSYRFRIEGKGWWSRDGGAMSTFRIWHDNALLSDWSKPNWARGACQQDCLEDALRRLAGENRISVDEAARNHWTAWPFLAERAIQFEFVEVHRKADLG